MKYNFDYFYGNSIEHFSFLRIPKALIKNDEYKELTDSSKLLYGLMLDRLCLSMKNNWFDERNRAYIIYTLKNVMEDLNCAHGKACKCLQELEQIGLIVRNRQGGNMPAVIYVMDFAAMGPEDENNDMAEKNKNGNAGTVEHAGMENSVYSQEGAGSKEEKEKVSDGMDDISPEVIEAVEVDFRKSEVHQDNENKDRQDNCGQTTENTVKSGADKNGLPKIGNLDFRFSEVNNTDNNNTDIYSNQSYLSYPSNPSDQTSKTQSVGDGLDTMDRVMAYRKIVRNNIGYDVMLHDGYYDHDAVDEIYELICDIVCVERDSIRIAGTDHPYALVKSRFLKLDMFDVQYVLDSLRHTTTRIRNIRAYLLTSLYNAKTKNNYFTQRVNRDTQRSTDGSG